MDVAERTPWAHVQQSALLALYETTRELATNPEPDGFLTRLVDRARRMLDADLAYLELLDKETDEFYVTVTSGICTEMTRRFRAKRNQGIVRLCLREGQPVAVVDVHSDPRRLSDFRGSITSAEGIASLLCAPVHSHRDKLGVLIIANRRTTSFSEDDIALIATLANVAAAAIEHARLSEGQHRRVVELEALNNILADQRDRLDRLLVIHDRLTRLVLQNAGIEAMAQTVAELVTNPVLLHDRFFHPLVQASPLGQHQPEPIPLDGTFQHLRSHPETGPLVQSLLEQRCPVQIPRVSRLGLHHPRVVAPAVVDNEVLGYVVIVGSNRALNGFDLEIVQHAAAAIALALMKVKTATDVEARLKGNFLDYLLSSDSVDERAMLIRASLLGYDSSRSYQAVVLSVDGVDDFAVRLGFDEEQVRAFDRTVFEAARHFAERQHPGSIVAPGLTMLGSAHQRARHQRAAGIASPHEAVIVLLATAAHQPPSTSRQVDELLRAIKRDVNWLLPDLTVSAGIGRIADPLLEVRRSYQEARTALNVLRSFGARNKVLTFAELGVYRVLARVDDRSTLVDFVEQTLGPLQRYDRRHQTELIRTLECFIQCNCAHKSTAETLVIHPHTLSYRLHRIEEISGLDLADPERRLDAQVALKLLRLLAP